jgi:hypothetical protein
VLVGLFGVFLGLVLVAGGGTGGGLAFVAIAVVNIVLGVLRRGAAHAHRESASPWDPQGTELVGEWYFALVALALLGGAIYMFAASRFHETQGRSWMAVFSFVAGIFFLGVCAFFIGHVFAARRVAAGKGGRIIRRLYPRLTKKD